MPRVEPRRTKIVATIGPASSEAAMIEALVEAGANAFRLNFSHGTHEDHAERARVVRDLEAASGWRTLALIADLQGPKLRIAQLPEPLTLARDQEVLVAGADGARDGVIPIAPSVIADVLQPGHEILIDDGHIRLRVEDLERGQARCAVLVGGTITSNKGVNLPGVPVPIPSITQKDVADLAFALDLGVDWVALTCAICCGSARRPARPRTSSPRSRRPRRWTTSTRSSRSPTR